MPRLRFISWLALGTAAIVCFLGYAGARAAWSEYRSANPRPHRVQRPEGDELIQRAADVTFSTARGLKIRGWWMQSRNGAAIILSHGSDADRRAMLGDAHLLSSLGYGVLVYDQPGNGESDGPAIWPRDAPEALSAAVDWVALQTGVSKGRLGVLGFSLGTDAVARVAARDQRLRAVVLEGSFTDADAQVPYEYRKWGPIQAIPTRWVMRACGMPPGSLRPIDQVGAIAPRPLLIIHGQLDPVVSVAMAHELFAAAQPSKELWILPTAHHGDYAEVAPAEYAQRIATFFAGALLTQPL